MEEARRKRGALTGREIFAEVLPHLELPQAHTPSKPLADVLLYVDKRLSSTAAVLLLRRMQASLCHVHAIAVTH